MVAEIGAWPLPHAAKRVQIGGEHAPIPAGGVVGLRNKVGVDGMKQIPTRLSSTDGSLG